MTACVACETALRDYQENVSTGQTHGQTDGQTDARQMCRYASQATQKPQHLKKKMTARVIFWILRVPQEFILCQRIVYIHGIFFRLAGNTAINFTRILTRPTRGTCDVSEV